jgi:hypothetical protein
MAFELVTGPLNRRPKSVGDWEESPDERKFFLDWLRSDEAAQNALVSVTMTVSCYEQAKSRADFDVANIQDGWLLDGGTDDPVEVEVPVRRCEKGWQVGYRAGFSARQPLISDEQFDSDLAVLYGDDGMRICWIEGVKAEINEDHEQWESKMYKRLNQPFEDNLIDLTQDAPLSLAIASKPRTEARSANAYTAATQWVCSSTQLIRATDAALDTGHDRRSG